MKRTALTDRQNALWKDGLRSPVLWISGCGLIAMTALFAMWMMEHPGYPLSSRLAALASAVLFTIVCLRFVPEWMKFWRLSDREPAFQCSRSEGHSQPPRFTELKIFITLLLLNALVLLLVFLIRRAMGYQKSFIEDLEFWRCLDSGSYLDIAENWYASEGETVVRLVFLPGFPIAIRLINWLIGNELYAGLIVAALCFPGAGAMFYRLLRLDYSHEDALRTVKYLCLTPGLFFFTAPMTEGMFLLLCVSCLYFVRTRRWALGCLLGGLAAFTRSMGVTLLVPLIMELVRSIRTQRSSASKIRWTGRTLSLMLVVAGLGAYLIVNYQVSGDFFKFQEYQSSHWSQNLGLFFNTAAYQLQYAIGKYRDSINSFLGLWLPNIISCFSALVLMIFGAKRMRASYVAWFIAYFFVAIGATWLLSAPRYLLVMITLPIAVSQLTRNPDVDLAATPLFVMANLLYLYAFVARWQVW